MSEATSPSQSSAAIGYPRADEPSRGGPGVATEPSRANARAKPGAIKSVLDLLEYAYSLKGKQVRVPQKVLRDIADVAPTDPQTRESFVQRLAVLMASDPLLAVPPRLLIGLEEGNATRLFKLRIARLFEAGLREHPLFRRTSDTVESEQAETARSDQTDYDALSTRIKLRTADIPPTELGIEGGSLKPAERDRLRTNAITTAALVASTLEEWSLDRLVEHLERQLWRDAINMPGALRHRVAITESSPADALGIVAKVFLDKASAADRAAEGALVRAAEAEDRANNLLVRAAAADKESERLRAVIDGQHTEIGVLQSSIEALKAQIEAERRDRVIDQSHHIDDYEILRTRIMRSLGKQVDLLSDGLHAVRNERYSVTEEFIERALDSLSRELRQLTDEGDL